MLSLQCPVAGRGGFVNRPVFNGKEMPENGCVLSDLSRCLSQGGLQTRPYPVIMPIHVEIAGNRVLTRATQATAIPNNRQSK